MRDKELDRAHSVDDVKHFVESGGHYRITFRPFNVNVNRLRVDQLQTTVRFNAVSFRGWDFPHIGREEEYRINANYLEAWTTWRWHEEIWRLYRSGQFVYLGGFREDNEETYGEKVRSSIAGLLTPQMVISGYLDTVNLTWVILEAVAFAARLGLRDIYKDGAEISIGLNNVLGYALGFSDYSRFYQHLYVCGENAFTVTRTVGYEDLTERFRETAEDMAKEVLSRFGIEPAADLVRNMQERLLPANKGI